jgi:hypothetical protein
MVVNGRAEFVGSDADRAEQEIARALSAPYSASLSARADLAGRSVVVQYDIEGRVGDVLLNAAVEEDGLVNAVRTGENAGRHLAHDGVVRAFVSHHPGESQSGAVTLPLPDGLDVSRSRVVVTLQDRSMMRIRAAAIADLEQGGEELHE